MRIPRIGFTLALAMVAASAAIAAPPAAPQVTMGADIKLLRFDWQPVTGASYYQLRFRPSVGAAYQPLGERIPATITQTEQSLPVHLQDWAGMRFIVSACNSDGCTNSAALNPRNLMLETIGYFKASNTDPQDGFGHVVLSDDGYTLAVTAPGESSNASGVNGNQADDSSSASGAVYVFRRRGNAWHQEAYLKAAVNHPQQFFGSDMVQQSRGLALSANGSVLAVAATHENFGSLEFAGAVHVFQRTSSSWRLVTTLHAPQPMAYGFFGMMTDLSDDGNTLKVNSQLTNIPFNDQAFRTHIFLRSGNTWQHSAMLAPFYPNDSCPSTRLSGDAQTLVSSCVTPTPQAGRLVTMKRAGGAWVHASDLPVSPRFREPIQLNRDATVMAITDGFDSRGVGIYRWIAGNWTREASFPAPASKPNSPPTWGWELALGNDGNLLAIGDQFAFEMGPGVVPAITPATVEMGAVYLYQRDQATNTWSLRNVIKSANPGFRDYFGTSISFSASGRTLVVGAPGENSNATGIDGVRANEEAPNAGAVYLY